MGNSIAWPIIHLVQRFSMMVTLACLVYVVFFLFSKNQDNPMPSNHSVAASKGIGLLAPAPVFELKPFVATTSVQNRDIFSLTPEVSPTGAVASTPKGQLPDHLKVVGILVADSPQIIIEDTNTKSTYFIDQEHPQAGIKMVRVDKNQMIINYQGGDIPVPIKKD